MAKYIATPSRPVSLRVLLDVSGSRCHDCDDDYHALNDLFAEFNTLSRQSKMKVSVTLVLFNHLAVKEVPLAEVPISKAALRPDSLPEYGGGTALYDAIYTDIHSVLQKNTKDGVVWVIITDGMDENSTRSAQETRALITQAKEVHKHSFVYLSEDLEQQGFALGIVASGDPLTANISSCSAGSRAPLSLAKTLVKNSQSVFSLLSASSATDPK